MGGEKTDRRMRREAYENGLRVQERMGGDRDMRVLWLCNIMLPAIAERLGLAYSSREGWLSGSFERIRMEKGMKGLELGVCCPVETMPEALVRTGGKFVLDGTACFCFVERLAEPERYDEGLEAVFQKILKDFKPDMVHIFGTEFPHTLAMVRAFGRPERTLVGIQGLCFACAESYMADLPAYVQKRKTLRDRIRRDGIRRQQEKFRMRGEREKEAIRGTGHITGRTDFDRAETAKVNPKAAYHFMNETMRKPFYSGSWSALDCEPHTVFLSQGDYPLKGFHYALRAMPKILEKYPDARLIVAGSNIISGESVKDRLKIPSYGKYLRELIKRNGLKDRVVMTGRLSAEEMKEEFLRCSLFLCPSALENSPNSMCEAMLLGVPVVAAAVGGIPSLLADWEEGILYEPGDADGLAKAVMRVWQDPETAEKRAQAARARAARAHDPDGNYKRLLEIYREITA